MQNDALQMGKSSLLKRLARRDPKRVHLVTMAGPDLTRDLERAKLSAFDQLVPAKPSEPVPFLLIDEADQLIRADRENDFALCRHLRDIFCYRPESDSRKQNPLSSR